MPPELRSAAPPIGHASRRWPRHAAAAACCHASIQPALHPGQCDAARRPRAGGGGPPAGTVHGHPHLPSAHDAAQEAPSETGEPPVCLAAPPGADEAQLLAIRVAPRLITHPGPGPTAARGFTLAGGLVPERHPPVHPSTAEALAPGALGERAPQAGGQVLVPAAPAAPCGVGATAPPGGTPHPHDLPQPLLLPPAAAFARAHQVGGEAQGLESRLQALGGVLCLAALSCAALLRFETAALAGWGRLFGLAWVGGPGVFLAIPCESLAVAACPSARSVSMMAPLRHVLPGLPACVGQRGAVDRRPHGLADAHPIFCTPPRQREGGRCPGRSASPQRAPGSSGAAA
jgi:hypothetical protein